MKTISKLLVAGAVAALAACSTYQSMVPDWMPGSGAISVKLAGGEEVPPLNVPGSGSGGFRVAEDGTITGAVTTKDVQGTMAHIHQAAKGQNGPVIVPLTKSGDGTWMTTAMYSEGQIAENLSQFCTWINTKRQDLLPTVQKPPVKKIFGITLHR